MCTAISMHSNKHYFGRNLDLSYHYDESVTITPRKFLLSFCDGQKTDAHYAMIGIATVMDNYPLYYDGVNECGLGIAALNFPGNAVYRSPRHDRTNVASYELIPWLLSQCANVGSVRAALAHINITDQAYSQRFTPTPLHWMIADADESVVLETTSQGIALYDNPIHVLTNNPPFPYHLYQCYCRSSHKPLFGCTAYNAKQLRYGRNRFAGRSVFVLPLCEGGISPA